MKHIILISVILLSGCSALRCFKSPEVPSIEQSQAVTVTADNARQALSDGWAAWLYRGAIIGMIGLVLSLVLHKIPGALHVAYLFGTLAGFCAIGIWSLAYIPYVVPVVIIALIGWGIYNIMKSNKVIKKVTALKDEAYINFEDPRGQFKLSPEGFDEYKIKRNKSKYWAKSPNNPDNTITKETEG